MLEAATQNLSQGEQEALKQKEAHEQALLAAKDNATKMEALALEIISGLHQVLGSVSSNHSL